MPELPEVEAALQVLRERAKGRTILRMQLLHPALQRRLAPAQLRALAGARISRVERRGKHQLLHLDDGRALHAHFRMNGDWALVDTGAELPRFARAVLELDDGASLVFVDSRALGTIDLHPAGTDLDLGLGPDAADPGWTAEQLAAALGRRRGPIKPALLDQQLIAGLGNIYAAEALWRARISPRAACSSVAARQVTALRKAIAAVIRRATGSRYTDDSTVSLDVYDREGLACRRCRTPIERIVQAGRSTYYCPTCQPDPVEAAAAKRSPSTKPAVETPARKQSTGEKPSGKKPSGKKPSGKKPSGKKPSGKKPSGGKSAREKAVRKQPARRSRSS